MNRKDFQEIANIRRREAKVLLDHGNYSGSYYLSGYVIECALKACIAKKTQKYDFPPDKKTIGKIYTHNLEELVTGAELKRDLDNERIREPNFDIYWGVVKDWNESSRYKKYIRIEAKNMYEAVVSRNHGVFIWIRQYW